MEKREDQQQQILVVEDEALIALDIEHVVEGLGAQVIGPAADAATAFRLADENEIDLALVDLNLNDGLTGPEIGERLIADYGIPVIFVTANWEVVRFSRGALGIVPKPFDNATLSAAIVWAGTKPAADGMAQPMPKGMIPIIASK